MGPKTTDQRIEEGSANAIEFRGAVITYNELHAGIIGCVGFLLGYIHQSGGVGEEYSVILTLVLVSYAVFGKPVLKTLPAVSEEYGRSYGVRAIRYEPMWFLFTFVPAFMFGSNLPLV